MARKLLALSFRRSAVRIGSATLLCLLGALLALASINVTKVDGAIRLKSSKRATPAIGPIHTPSIGSWSLVDAPNVTQQRLLGVACVSTTDCWAVGHYVSPSGMFQTLAEHWDGNSWSLMSSPNTNSFTHNHLESVACNSSADCWAAGYSEAVPNATLIEHWDGNSWSIVSSPNPGTRLNQFFGVACASSSDCWAVGNYLGQRGPTRTLTEHWNGSSWSVVSSPTLSTGNWGFSQLHGVACTSASDCWAVGDGNATTTTSQTLTEHWDGTAWTIVSSPSVNTLNNVFLGITCTSSTNCLAVGYYDTGAVEPNNEGIERTLAERWNGNSWSIVTSPNPAPDDTDFLYNVSCVSASNCWAAGYATDFQTYTIAVLEQWNGSSWTAITAPLNDSNVSHALVAVTCVPGAHCWAVGYGGYQYNLTERWDSNSWSIVPSVNATGGGTSNDLSGVACASTTDCWAVGEDGIGEVYVVHWNGAKWSQVSVHHPEPLSYPFLSDVACLSSTNCWAVGDYLNADSVYLTLVEHWDGSSWSNIASPNNGMGNSLDGISCNSATDCWAVGSYYDANSNADRTLTEHWDGNVWMIVDSPNVNMTTSSSNFLISVSCLSSSNCWAVGGTEGTPNSSQTLIEHWDGNTWGIVASPNAAQFSALARVTCTSASDCWAVGNSSSDASSSDSLIEHWNGSIWSIVILPSIPSGSYLNGLACASNSNCWAVGPQDLDFSETLTLHWDGNVWTVVKSPNINAGNELEGVACPTSTHCWAVGYSPGDPNPGFNPVIENLIEEFNVALALTSTGLNANGHFILAGQTAPNVSVDIQATGNLTTPFQTIDTVTADGNGIFNFEDEDSAGFLMRFYRASAP